MKEVKIHPVVWTFAVIIGILIFFLISQMEVIASSTPVEKNKMDFTPFIWAILIVGGSIAVTLTYVSWRKYKGEQKRLQKKDKIID